MDLSQLRAIQPGSLILREVTVDDLVSVLQTLGAEKRPAFKRLAYEGLFAWEVDVPESGDYLVWRLPEGVTE